MFIDWGYHAVQGTRELNTARSSKADNSTGDRWFVSYGARVHSFKGYRQEYCVPAGKCLFAKPNAALNLAACCFIALDQIGHGRVNASVERDTAACWSEPCLEEGQARR